MAYMFLITDTKIGINSDIYKLFVLKGINRKIFQGL